VYYQGPELDYRFYSESVNGSTVAYGTGWVTSGLVSPYTFTLPNGDIVNVIFGSVQHTVRSAGTFNGQMYVERV